jgi:hypothetical protein
LSGEHLIKFKLWGKDDCLNLSFNREDVLWLIRAVREIYYGGFCSVANLDPAENIKSVTIDEKYLEAILNDGNKYHISIESMLFQLARQGY